MARSAGIIAAAGSGERLGASLPKALVQIAGISLIERAFASLSKVVDEIIITAPAGYEDQFRVIFGESAKIVTGGATRSKSVHLALEAISPDVNFILVHDAARAFASSELAEQVLAHLRAGEVAVIPGIEITDTIKSINVDNYVTITPDRKFLRAVQTPQGFTRALLIRAHGAQEEATDDAALVEALGEKVKIIAGEQSAFKITTKDDLLTAYHLVYGNKTKEFKTGVGVDLHAFSSDPSRPLYLAGLKWDGEVGVDGHSDGDVAAHAICDALFGAAQLGDLGSNFGVSDPRYAGASGAILLGETLKKVNEAGFIISNVSVQIVGNRPKIGARRKEAIEALSDALGGASVSVTATTTDGLGFTGEGKGIFAIARALIYKI